MPLPLDSRLRGNDSNKKKHSIQPHNKNTGFSLIELMVVLVIVGIVLTFAVLAFGDFGRSHRLKAALNRFETVLPLAKQQAIAANWILGLRVTNRGYAYYHFIPNPKTHQGQWHNFQAGSVFAYKAWPQTLKITINAAHHSALNSNALPNAARKHIQPQIIISPSGDVTPFAMHVNGKKIVLSRHSHVGGNPGNVAHK